MAKDATEIFNELLESAAGAVAIEAMWDGDTRGWFVYLDAVFKSDTGFRTEGLKTFRFGSDLRLFNGEVPPWPEAAAASELGTALAQQLGVPFHFPASQWPEGHCPHWWQLDQSVPCDECGVRLLQPEDLPWRGCCHRCQLSRESAARESALTPLERASPRCQICVKPMVGAASDETRCSNCWANYREREKNDPLCTDCGEVRPLKRHPSDVPTCLGCLVGRLMSRSTAAERREMAKRHDGRIDRMMELVGCGIGQAHVLYWDVIYNELDQST